MPTNIHPAATKPKRGPGRPSLASGDTVNLNFRVPAELAEFVHADALRLGQTYAEWLRRLIEARRKAVEGGRNQSKQGEKT